MVTINEIWAKIREKYPKAEQRAKEWLEKIKGFKIEDWHKGKPSNKPYDILASKRGKLWAIEVKSGKKPTIKLSNFQKLLEMKNVDMIGLILVINNYPHLLLYNKHTYFADKAWITINKKKEIKTARY